MDHKEPTKPDFRVVPPEFENKGSLENTAQDLQDTKPILKDADAESQVEAEVEADLTPSQWFVQNSRMLIIVLAVFLFLFYKFGVDGLISIGWAAVGLGLVIFIHELGHFLVAKWCGVYVQTFSIGFGPAIPGCHFKWGETYYKLALFPLGGYVQMLGQVDGHEENDGTDDDPRSYKNKTVLQRMAIISAGVIMNVILAILCFVLVYQAHGKQQRAAVVSMVDSGSPSFTHAIPTGALIHKIGDIENPNFEDLTFSVISSHESELTLVYSRPGDKQKTTVSLIPRKESGDDRPLIGLAPSFEPKLEEKRFLGAEWKSPVIPKSAAANAKPKNGESGFTFGDEIIATTDPDNPNQIKELPMDPRHPDGKQRDYFELVRRMQLLAGKEVVFRVQRKEKGETKTVDIPVAPEFHTTLGAVMKMGEITAVRNNSEAAAKIQKGKGKEHEGDVIETLEVTEPDGTVTRFTQDQEAKKEANGTRIVLLDPVRLPDQLREWAKRMEKAGKSENDLKVTLKVRRKAPPGNFKEFESKEVKLTWDKSWQFDRVEPFSKESPQAIPELGFGYQVKTMVVHADPGFTGGEDKLQQGDVIQQIQIHSIMDEDGTERAGSWNPLEPHQWAHAFWVMQSPNVSKVVLKINRNSETREITLIPQSLQDWPSDQRGLVLARDQRLQKAKDFFDAVALGLRDTHNNVMRIFTVLRSMFTGGLSPNNIGGPVMIANIAYRYASIDLWEFIFFLGMISINLAVINFLPIPVLDGGHMVFLTYELIRGKPASEQVRVGATYVGLLFIACLFLFVLYLDISRLFLR